VVYHGYVGQLLLRDLPNVLKVRIIAPMEYRVRSAMIELNLSREAAAKHIEGADVARRTWVRKVYDVDVTDPTLYDLVLNLGHMSMETATELIVDLLGREDFRSTTETQQQLKDFALLTRIRATLALKSEFEDADIEVSVNHGVVDVAVPAGHSDRRSEIVRFVQQIEGVEQVGGLEAPRLDDVAIPAQSWRTASDLMLPLDRYPHVHDSLPIRDCLLALGASSVVSSDGHLVCPRYLLVLDDVDRLIGVINRRALLRGLIPQYASLMRAKAKVGTAMPFADAMSPSDLLWNTLFSPSAVTAARKPVSAVMAPIRATVAHDDTLSTVVSTMLQHDVDLIPVTDGERTVGVILMTDVFDSVAEFVLEQGAQ
ncbi:MAG: cytidylate kinase family protein, partial [Gemmatimonadales bacterium]|jgi:CBS domain-containing protein